MHDTTKVLVAFLVIVVSCGKIYGKPSNIDKVYKELDDLKEKLGALKDSFDGFDGNTKRYEESYKDETEESVMAEIERINGDGGEDLTQIDIHEEDEDVSDLAGELPKDDEAWLKELEAEDAEAKDKEEYTMGLLETVNENSDNDHLHDVDIMTEGGDMWDDEEFKRSAIFRRDRLWTTRDVPYEIDPGAGYSDSEKAVIQSAMDTISNVTCIKFHQKVASDPHWLRIIKSSGCWSFIGNVRRTTGQSLSIGQGCASKRIVMHEILHALGFFHEQSRYDRDKFVEILWENIQPGKENNFRKLTTQNSLNLNSPYDLTGIMHYSPYSFTKNGKPTIKALGGKSIIRGREMSVEDINGVNRLYDCKNIITGWSSWSDYTPCDANCVKSRSRFCGSTDTSLCPGSVLDTETCTEDECKTDGHWGHWTAFGACTSITACSPGTKTRSRLCDNPSPTGKGLPCPGSATESVECKAVCPSNCTFDDDFCGWTESNRWRRRTGTTPSSNTGPSDDLTGGGSYAYTETSSLAAGTLSRLSSPYFSKEGPICFEFNYHMYGNTMGSLTLYQEIDNNGITSRTSKWTLSGDQGDAWNKVQINVGSPGIDGFTLEFDGVSGSSFRGDSAIDNLVLFDAPCQPVSTAAPVTTEAPTPEPVTTEAPTPAPVTTEAPTPAPVTTEAPTPAPVTTEAPTPEPVTTEAPTPEPVTTESPTPEPVTTEAPTPEPVTTEAPTPEPVTTEVPPPEPVTTEAPTPEPVTTEGPTAEPVTTETPIVGEAVKFDCQFESGVGKLCGMTQPASNNLTWKVENKPTNILERRKRTVTGPTADRDAERGHFLYVSSYNGGNPVEGKQAVVNTPKFNGSGFPQAIEFYYHMYNNDKRRRRPDGMGTLAVNIVDETAGVTTNLKVFNKTAGRNWNGAIFNFEVAAQNVFYVQFVATIGKDNRSDIAIDDISILPDVDPFPDIPSPTIASCSFQSDFCAYSQVGDFHWSRRRGGTPTYGTGPNRAVTQEYSDSYAYIEASAPRKQGDVAGLRSPLVFTSNPMCLYMFVHMVGANIGSLEGEFLELDESNNNTMTPVLAMYAAEPLSRIWWEERIQLPTDVKFQFEINATVGDGPRGDIAIDNILVRPGECEILDSVENLVCDFDTKSTCPITGKHVVKTENVDGVENNYAQGRKLTLVVPEVPERGACLSFQYRLTDRYSRRVARLLISVFDSRIFRKRYKYFNSRKERVVKRIYDRAEHVFVTERVSLPPGPGVRKDYKVIIRRQQSRRDKGTFDLDNVTIAQGFCAPAITA